MYLHSWGHGLCSFEIQWKVLTFPMLNVIKTIKIWSKWKLSRFPSFRFQLEGKIENSQTSEIAIFLLKSHHKNKVFLFWVVFQSVFRFWVSYTTKNISKRKLSEVSKFSISSIGQNRKLGTLGNWHFFFWKHVIKLTFFLLGHFPVSF